jgi:serine/threonine protein phosphatase PrpC
MDKYSFTSIDSSTDIGNSNKNQDRVFTTKDLICVFDGHGDHGEAIAQGAMDYMRDNYEDIGDYNIELLFSETNNICRHKMRIDLVKKDIKFIEENNAFYRPNIFYGYEPSIPISGGTTATFVKVSSYNKGLICANIGDSEAVFFDSDDDEGTIMTSDHSPTSLSEYLRVHSINKHTKFLFADNNIYPCRFIWYLEPSSGKWKMNPQGGYFCSDVRKNWASYIKSPDNKDMLAMTRSFGDFNLQRYGVSSVPDINYFEPQAEGITRAIVVASDGLWDAVQYKEVRNVVRSPENLGNAKKATEEVLKLGIQKSIENFKTKKCHDNITVAVAYV